MGALTMWVAAISRCRACGRVRFLHPAIMLRDGGHPGGDYCPISSPGPAAIAGKRVWPKRGNIIIADAGHQKHAVRILGPVGGHHIVLRVDARHCCRHGVLRGPPGGGCGGCAPAKVTLRRIVPRVPLVKGLGGPKPLRDWGRAHIH